MLCTNRRTVYTITIQFFPYICLAKQEGPSTLATVLENPAKMHDIVFIVPLHLFLLIHATTTTTSRSVFHPPDSVPSPLLTNRTTTTNTTTTNTTNTVSTTKTSMGGILAWERVSVVWWGAGSH